MILSKSEILKKCDYVISYDFQSQAKTGIISVGMDRVAPFAVKYNYSLKSLCTNWLNQVIPCPDYACVAITWLILEDICQYYKYPLHLVEYTHDQNPKTSYIFDILETEEEVLKASYVYELSSHFTKLGLHKNNIVIAKKKGIWEGYKAICEYYLGVKIE